MLIYLLLFLFILNEICNEDKNHGKRKRAHRRKEMKERRFQMKFSWLKWKDLLTSAMLFNEGAAINTTYGVNSDVRKIFSACGSTSKMAIFPSLWMRRIVSNLVPYIASSWVPVKYHHKYYDYKHCWMRLVPCTKVNFAFGEPFIQLLPINLLIRQRIASTKETENKNQKKYLPYSKYSLAAMSAIISSCDTK